MNSAARFSSNFRTKLRMAVLSGSLVPPPRADARRRDVVVS
jgi:hypothetical protein